MSSECARSTVVTGIPRKSSSPASSKTMVGRAFAPGRWWKGVSTRKTSPRFSIIQQIVVKCVFVGKGGIESRGTQPVPEFVLGLRRKRHQNMHLGSFGKLTGDLGWNRNQSVGRQLGFKVIGFRQGSVSYIQRIAYPISPQKLCFSANRVPRLLVESGSHWLDGTAHRR